MNKHVHDTFAAKSETPTTVTAEARARIAAAGYHVYPPTKVPSLLEGTFGASDATKAAVAALEGLILRAEAAGADHTAAEVEFGLSSDAAEAAYDIWDAALDDIEAATDALLEHQPASPSDARARMIAFLRASVLRKSSYWQWDKVELAAPAAMIGWLERRANTNGDEAAELGAALRYVLEQDICVIRPNDAWEDALRAFKDADAAYYLASAETSAISRAIRDRIPEPLSTRNRNGKFLRWMSLANFDKERGPAHLRGALEACIADQKRREEEADLNTRDEHDERLAVAADDTYDALMSVPPPSAAAFAEKLLIQSIRIDDERGGFTDPAYVAQQLHSYLPNRAAVLAYIDARHLAGDRSPLAGADFNPRAWIRLYEAAGGAAQERADRGGLMLGRAFQCKDPSSCRALEDELYYTPWKARAVRMEVLEDNYSTHGPNDNTGRFSWLLFTDADFNILTPRIHFVREDDDRGPSSGPSGGGNLPSAAAA